MKFMNLEFAFSGFQESCGDLSGFRLAVRVPRDTWADNIQRRRRLVLSHVLGLSPLALTSQLASSCPQEVIKPTDRVMPRRGINEKILSVDYSEFRAEIKTVDAQESLDGGIVVLVTGYLTGKDNVKRNFTQSFFLATQDKGYYVLNDIFRYVDDGNDQWESGALTSGDRAPLAPEQGFDGTLEQQQEAPPKQDQQVTEAPEEVELNEGEVFNSPEIEDAPTLEEEAPTIQMIDEVAKISQTAVADSGSAAILEGAPKKSYASIVRVCP
ncbi:hypothetical protein B296_00007931 [Ensete ventricosum]|uniref:NTF2 domain-containing protein n=1 Tax=Ensete ventricosum TaxID=4639 RepID=A0A427AQ83_ENSVE|nr:hypothetical protein B296_00007931 [Ensete ventricosum]